MPLIPFSDPWLDSRLREVPLPVGFFDRLSRIGPPHDSAVSDEHLDTELQNVPLVTGVFERLERIARSRRSEHPWLDLATAASVVMAVTVSYLSLLIAFLGFSYSAGGRSNSTLIARASVRRNADKLPPKKTEIRVARSEPSKAETPEITPPSATESLASTPADEVAPTPPSVDEVAPEPPSSPTLASSSAPSTPSTQAPSSSPPERAEARVYGTGGGLDALPELELVGKSPLRGIAPPRVAGYDLLFQLKHGDHPFVNPEISALQTSRVPLSSKTSSFEATARMIAAGRLPAPEDVRLEDFLAAMDYNFPPARPGTLDLHTAAGPSLFEDGKVSLLQLAVHAGPVPAHHGSAQLVVALQTTAGMRSQARFALLRQALVALADRLGEADGLTIVAIGPQPRVIATQIKRGASEQLAETLRGVKPQGPAEFRGGIDVACDEARRIAATAGPRRIVLVVDGETTLPADVNGQIEDSVSRIAAEGVPVDVIEVHADSSHASTWDRFSTAGRGRDFVTDADEVRWALAEALTGHSQVAAHEAALRITFEPKSVAAYRLLGHEAATITGPTTNVTPVDFHAGETATALYELWLKPDGGDRVATVELSWRDSRSGRISRHMQRINRGQFTKSFATAAPSLQTAAVAAEAAEALKGSYFAPSGRPLKQVLDLSSQVSPRAAEGPAFARLVELVERADKARISGTSAHNTPRESAE